MKTRDRILHTSLALFNEEGEAVVSGGDDDNGRLNSSDAEGARNLTLTDFIGR